MAVTQNLGWSRCDGSDSVFLYYDNTWEVSASFIKNNTQTSGLGFRIDG